MCKWRETEFQLVVECRIPGGKVERAGKREGERKTQVLTAKLKRTRKKIAMERERNQEEGRREPDREEGKRKAEVKVYRSTHPPNQTWNSIFHNTQVQMDLHHKNGLISCIDFQLFVEFIIPVWRAERTRQ